MDLPKLKIGPLEANLPIIQGGMAVRISLAPLAAAVANEGGIGLIAASGLHPPELAEHLRQVRKLTDGLVGVNVMVAVREFAQLVKIAIKEKADLIVAGAGFSRDVFKWCREANVPFVSIVSSVKAACLSERVGAAAVIAEGGEAGGHLGTTQPLFSILPEIVKVVKIPVIAAGGILKGEDIARAFSVGAKGVQIGTRFAASQESSAAPEWKETYLKARPEDVFLIESPVGMPGQAVLNPFLKRLFAGKVPRHTNIERCVRCLKFCKKNYCIIEALEKAQQGDMENGLVFSGKRVGEIKKILPVKEIIKNLKREFREVTERIASE